MQQGAGLASLRSNAVRGGETPGHQDPTHLATKRHRPAHKHLSGHCFTQRSQKSLRSLLLTPLQQDTGAHSP